MDEDQTVKREIIGVNLEASRNIERAYSVYEASVVLGREIEERMGKTEEEQQQATDEQREEAARLWSVETFLSAFGIETALKALIRRQEKEPKKELKKIHDLHHLYKELEAETQERICEKVKNTEEVMKAHRNSFLDWRYGESGKNLDVSDGVLRETLKAMIETYREKYPYEPIGSKVGTRDSQD